MNEEDLPRLLQTIQSAFNCAKTGRQLGGNMFHCVENTLTWQNPYSFTWEMQFSGGKKELLQIQTADHNFVVAGTFFIPDPKNPALIRYFTFRGDAVLQAYQAAIDQMMPERKTYTWKE